MTRFFFIWYFNHCSWKGGKTKGAFVPSRIEAVYWETNDIGSCYFSQSQLKPASASIRALEMFWKVVRQKNLKIEIQKRSKNKLLKMLLLRFSIGEVLNNLSLVRSNDSSILIFLFFKRIGKEVFESRNYSTTLNWVSKFFFNIGFPKRI